MKKSKKIAKPRKSLDLRLNRIASFLAGQLMPAQPAFIARIDVGFARIVH